MRKISALESIRKDYQPKLPLSLRQGITSIQLNKGKMTQPESDQEAIQKIFPTTYGLPVIQYATSETPQNLKALKVGVILSGGQAPGGHNVISGLFDGIKSLDSKSTLYGFLGGPSGLENGEYIEIDSNKMDAFRNTGGFDIIGSGRTKLETTEQFDRCIAVVQKLELDAIVVIGGDDSNTNAAVLAEYLKGKGLKISVIGVPKTIDGDLKNEYIPTSFGFDTACKVYSELVGNIARDASSAKKYWHFIKLMGRSASHIALEVALQTRPNVALISEEIAANKSSLEDVVQTICDSILARSQNKQNYGIVLIPEGLIEFIPSINKLISNLNDILAEKEAELESIATTADKVKALSQWLEADDGETLQALPERIQAQLLLDRDPHGNVQVSRIETEVLLIELVQKKLNQLKSEGQYQGSFSEQHHFFGYEGRCAAPSNFDADYTYSLGYGAVALIAAGETGYMSSVTGVTENADHWKAGGIPITMLFNMEQRHGAQKAVIKKALVELNGAPFNFFKENRATWAVEDNFLYPGPIQYFGPEEVCDLTNVTLQLENKKS